MGCTTVTGARNKADTCNAAPKAMSSKPRSDLGCSSCPRSCRSVNVCAAPGTCSAFDGQMLEDRAASEPERRQDHEGDRRQEIQCSLLALGSAPPQSRLHATERGAVVPGVDRTGPRSRRAWAMVQAKQRGQAQSVDLHGVFRRRLWEPAPPTDQNEKPDPASQCSSGRPSRTDCAASSSTSSGFVQVSEWADNRIASGHWTRDLAAREDLRRSLRKVVDSTSYVTRPDPTAVSVGTARQQSVSTVNNPHGK